MFVARKEESQASEALWRGLSHTESPIRSSEHSYDQHGPWMHVCLFSMDRYCAFNMRRDLHDGMYN